MQSTHSLVKIHSIPPLFGLRNLLKIPFFNGCLKSKFYFIIFLEIRNSFKFKHVFVCDCSNNKSSYVESGIRTNAWRSNHQQNGHRNIQNNHVNLGGRNLPQTPKTPSTLPGHLTGTHQTPVI